jgi:hypothetical protein
VATKDKTMSKAMTVKHLTARGQAKIVSCIV